MGIIMMMESVENASEMTGCISYLLEEERVPADLRNNPLCGLLKEAQLQPWKPCFYPRISEGGAIRSHGWINGSRSGVFYFSIDPILRVSDPYSEQWDLLHRITGLNQAGRTFQRSML